MQKLQNIPSHRRGILQIPVLRYHVKILDIHDYVNELDKGIKSFFTQIHVS